MTASSDEPKAAGGRIRRSEALAPMRGIIVAALLGVIVWIAVILGLIFAVNALR